MKAAGLSLFILMGGLLARGASAAPPEKVAEKIPEKIEPVASRAPEGFVEMFVAGVLPTEGGPAVVLRDKAEKTLIPIWIGMSEAHSIQLRLERRRFPRPLTHDLLDQIVHDLGGEIVKIHVDDLKGDTFVGTVFVKKGDKVSHFDARPSDSIALAVGNQVPIFVSRAVIDRINTKREEGKEPSIKDDDEDEAADETPAKASPKSSVQTL
jgi:bifunctional DNase/RNase